MATNQEPKPRIRFLREARGLTRQKVATFLGVSLNALKEWETKTHKARELVVQILLCEALQCHPEDLIDTSLPKNLKSLEQIRQKIRKVCSELDNDWPRLKISELRRSMNLTQEQLAAAIGIEYKTLQNWESGRTSSKKLIDLIRLCDILQCEPKDLVCAVPAGMSEQFCKIFERDPVELFNGEQNFNTNDLYDSSINSASDDKLNRIRENVRMIQSRPHTLDSRM